MKIIVHKTQPVIIRYRQTIFDRYDNPFKFTNTIDLQRIPLFLDENVIAKFVVEWRPVCTGIDIYQSCLLLHFPRCSFIKLSESHYNHKLEPAINRANRQQQYLFNFAVRL